MPVAARLLLRGGNNGPPRRAGRGLRADFVIEDPALTPCQGGIPVGLAKGHVPEVGSFTIAAFRRVYDQVCGQWKDGDTLFLYWSAWRDLAKHAADSLQMGHRHDHQDHPRHNPPPRRDTKSWQTAARGAPGSGFSVEPPF